jgi:hypothetical protein
MKSRLSMVIQLNLPAPLGVIACIPPLFQDADLATDQEHQSPDILLTWPNILAFNAIIAARKSGYGCGIRRL